MSGIQKIKGVANLEILQNFLEKFLSLTGLCVGFCDTNAEFVSNAVLSRKFCDITGKSGNPSAITDCHSSILAASKSALKTKKPVIFMCHAGLAEAVIPILINDYVIGFAVTGQARLAGKKSSRKSPHENKHYKDVPLITRDKLQASVNILFIVVNYIFRKENEFLTLNEDGRQKTYVQEIIGKAVNYIKKHYKSHDLSVNEVAEVIHISPFYFSHIFRREIHTTFKDYLTSVRLEEIIKALKENTSKTIKEIAFENGYGDPYYFSRVFKKAYKISPARFRRQFL